MDIKKAEQVFMTIDAARNFENKYPDLSKTPYFNEEYKFANIILAGKRAFGNVKTRIDVAAQETYFIASNGIEIKLEVGIVKEITYADTTAEGIIFYKFKTGYPAIDRQNRNNFYLVLAEGRCSFIKSVIKKAADRKEIVYGDVAKEYETIENYYLFVKGEIKNLKKDKDFILAELSDKQEQVNEFIQSNKLNVKNNEDLARLISYYNSL